MDSPVKPSPQLRFLEEMANHYVFTGDTRTVFLNRFDERNAKKVNIVLVSYIDWSRTPEDGAQKLQDELKKICQVLEKEGCPIEKTTRGRQPKGRSPWEQAFKWLWQSKFPEWQQSQTINADNSETNSIEERIFRATEQLNRRGFSALVGIQALEEIAKDSPRYHWKIMELLAAFVRRKAPRREENEGDEERSPELREDIQTALTVIGQRNPEKDPANKTLDLSNTDIENALLIEAKLDGAFLIKANLQEANLSEATLQGAFLNKAKLRKAIFLKANLQGANLSEAILQGAFLTRSCLQNANLCGGNLQQADLTEANLQNANLNGANLQEADLSGARLKGAYFGKANLNRAYLIGADLDGVDLSGASLQGAYLYEADLTKAKNIELKEIESAHRDIHTLLPESIAQLAYWKQFS